MPAIEFFFSGTAFWGVAVFLFTSVLAVIAIQQHWAYWPAICLLPILGGGLWLATARTEAAKSKPERDYAYFILSDDPRDTNGEATALVSIATGPLTNVDVAIQTALERKKGSRQYIFFHHFQAIAEGSTLLAFGLPSGDYWIDSDQPAKLGQVLEHIQIEKQYGKLVATINVIRKTTNEVLFPSSETISFSGWVILSLICLAFMGFAAVLGWASWVTP